MEKNIVTVNIEKTKRWVKCVAIPIFTIALFFCVGLLATFIEESQYSSNDNHFFLVAFCPLIITIIFIIAFFKNSKKLFSLAFAIFAIRVIVHLSFFCSTPSLTCYYHTPHQEEFFTFNTTPYIIILAIEIIVLLFAVFNPFKKIYKRVFFVISSLLLLCEGITLLKIALFEGSSANYDFDNPVTFIWHDFFSYILLSNIALCLCSIALLMYLVPKLTVSVDRVQKVVVEKNLPIEKRLLVLNDQLKQGVITEEEYNKKRTEIISKL